MAKYGSSSAWMLVDGADLGGYLTEFNDEKEGVLEESTVIGNTYQAHSPVGVRKAKVTASGFYDDASNASNAIAIGQTTSRIVCYGYATNTTLGAKFVGAEGAYFGKYNRTPTRNQLHKFNAEVTVSGQVDECIVIQELEAKTADWDTTGADSQDAGASSSGGAAAYMQVTAFSGFSGFVGKVRHSSDDVTYADLITFSNVTSGPTAQRGTSSGTVNRHLAFDGNVTGSGSITVMCGVARL
jgi:hypothetical protein